MKRTTYLVAIPNWALAALITWDYGQNVYDDLTREQSKQLNDWIARINPNGYGFICHDPEEGDQPNCPVIPAFGDICDSTVCYFTVYHE